METCWVFSGIQGRDDGGLVLRINDGSNETYAHSWCLLS